MGKYCSTDYAAKGRWKFDRDKMLKTTRKNQKIAAKSRIGLKHSKDTIKQISKNRKGKAIGENNPRWNNGATPFRVKLYHSDEYRKWRNSVFERDNYTCQNCGIKSGNGKRVMLEAHHIKPFAVYVDLRFETNNGQTLCAECHNKTKKYFYGNQYISIYIS